jgi:hypothetical protein
MYICGILIGTYLEQRDLRISLGDLDFKRYTSVIPNVLIPDILVLLLKNNTELDSMRSIVNGK